MPADPIAIVGIGCRFPGADSPDALYANLIAGTNSVLAIPEERLLLKRHARASERHAKIPDFGGFLSDVTAFDAALFRFSPREVEATDPQQRLMLQVAFEAIEDAAIAMDDLRGSYVPVYVGSLATDYQGILFSDIQTVDLYGVLNTTHAALAGRISHCFDWKGPAVGLDTACSSSLTAMHLACQSIWAGDAEVAMFGASNVLLAPELSLAYTRAGMLALDGQCKAFDARGDGFVRSEGAAAIIVKRLSAAVRDGNPIYATVRATWLNHDGGLGQYKTPSREGQRQMLEAVYARAGLSPLDTQYIEAHGTGTRAGDPVEVGAIGDVLCAGRSRETPLYIGSIKTNIGHCEAAAGMASVAKVALSLRQRRIPKNLHFHEPNPAIAWDELALRVPTETIEWPQDAKIARASVSSFGLTGVNAHAILEAAPEPSKARDRSGRASVWVISAPDRERVALQCQRVVQALEATPEADSDAMMCSVARTLSVGRRPHEFRAALMGQTRAELTEALTKLARGEHVGTGICEAAGPAPAVCFVFSGHGGQWPGMGRQLLSFPVFEAALNEIASAVEREAGFNPIIELSRSAEESRLDDHAIAQPTIFAIQVALVELWRSWGVTPSAVVGHSMGEVSAAYVAGIFDLQTAVAIICRRSRIMKQAPSEGAMLVVELSEPEIDAIIAQHPRAISLAVHNSPTSRVLSGDTEILQRLAAELEAHGSFARFIKVGLASHSPQMDPVKAELLAALADVRGKPGKLALYSTVRPGFGRAKEDGPRFDAQYFWENLRHTVRFSDAVADLVADGHTLFVEVNPHPMLCQAIGQTQAAAKPLALPSMRRNEDQRETLLRTAAELFVRGVPVDWRVLLPAAPLLHLPPTPLRDERFAVDYSKRDARGAHTQRLAYALPVEVIAVPDRTAEARWQVTLDPSRQALWAGHCVEGEIVFPAAGYIELGWSLAARLWGTADVPELPQNMCAEQFRFERALSLSATEPTLLHVVATRVAEDRIQMVFATAQAQRHAEGSFVRRPAVAPAARLESDLSWSTGVDEQAELYAWLGSLGLQYAGPFRALEQAYYGHGKGIGKLARAAVADEHSGFSLHPATLDVCFQVAFTSSADLRTGEPNMFLPTQLRALRCYAPSLAQAERVSARRGRSDNDNTLVVDLDIWDGDGALLAQVEGFSATRLDTATPAHPQSLLWQMSWPKLALDRVPARKSLAPARWLVFLDERGLGARVAELLEARGHSLVRVTRSQRADAPFQVLAPGRVQMRAGMAEHHHGLLGHAGTLDGVLDFWPMLEHPSDDADAATVVAAAQRVGMAVVENVKALAEARQSPRLWLITREVWESQNAALAARAVASAVWGVGRVLAVEQPELRCSLIDVSGDVEAVAQRIVDEVVADSAERELRLCSESRRVGRIINAPAAATALPAEISAGPLAPFVIERTSRSLQLLPTSEPAARADEVVIEVEALRIPCEGDAVALPMVLGGQVQEGSRGVWIGPAGRAGSVVAVPAAEVWALPDDMGLATAVGNVAHYAAAYHALLEVGRLEPGTRLLIVGSATIALPAAFVARWARAQVVLLCAADAQRAMQRFGAHNLVDADAPEAAENVREALLGARADLLLIAGELPLIDLSELLEPDGRCVWLPKNERATPPRVRANQTLHALDLEHLMQARTPAVQQSLKSVQTLLEQQAWPMLDFATHKLEELSELDAAAWGTVTLEQPRRPVLRVPGAVRSDRSYLITGGLGGLGLTVAHALVDAGARSVVAIGRSAPSAQAAAQIELLRERGITFTTLQADVAREQDVRRVLSYIETRLPPLAGIVHSAGVLADAIVLRQDAARFARVFGAKANGAWNLVRALPSAALDFFVLFSSAAGLLGSPGQSNYAAANCFLDGLASALRARGVPAKSLQWGPWAEVGLAARTEGAARLATSGLPFMSARTGSDAFMHALGMPEAILAAMHLDGQAWAANMQGAADDPRLEHTLSLPPLAARMVPPPRALAELASEQEPITQTLPRVKQKVSERPEDILGDLCAAAARLLRVSEQRIDARKSIAEQGMDSLMMMELRGHIEERHGIKLPIAMLVKGPSLKALAEHLEGTVAAPTAGDAPAVELGSPALDLALAADVRPQVERRARPIERVVLIGATGYLGRYLATELLRQGAREVCCLVRAEDDAHAQARVRSLLAADVQASANLKVLSANLEREHLGLGRARLQALLANSDAVIHNAASVHFRKSYAALRQTNVQAWLDVLRASAATLPMLHYVSSWGAFSTATHAGKPVLESDWPCELPSGGYRAAKYVCEQLAREARQRGFPVQVHRPTLIGLDSHSGASNPRELFTALVTTVVRCGLAPDLDMLVPSAPVDAVAEGMARVVLDGVLRDFSYHWLRQPALEWRALLDWLAAEGVMVKRLPYARWRREVAPKVVGSNLEPFIAMLPDALSAGSFGYLEAALRENQPWPFDNARTSAAASGVLDGPAFDAEAWRQFLRRLRTSNASTLLYAS